MTTSAGWEEYELGELFRLSNGINADKSAYGQGAPFINVLEVITNESLTASDIPGRVALPTNVLARYEVKRGDVLFNRTSETQDEVALASVYVDDQPVVFGGFVFRGRPLTSALEVNYSKYALRATYVRQQITARGQGGIRANVGQRDLKSVVIRLPDRSEQRAIAEALDDVSALIQALERLVTKTQAIRQGMMQQLLTGRTRLPGFTGLWKDRCAIADVCDRISGYWGADDARPRASTPVQVIRAGDISGEGKLTGWADRYFSAAEWKKSACHASDSVVTTSGNGLGKSFFVREPARLAASNFVRILRPRHGVSGEYISYVMLSEPARLALDTHTATSAYPNLLPSFFVDPWFALPGFAEQQAIAEAIRSVEDQADGLRARLVKARAIKSGMMQELLTARTRLPLAESAA